MFVQQFQSALLRSDVNVLSHSPCRHVLSAHKHHANVVFTPSTREAFVDELSEYDTGKGSVKLPYGNPVPTELLERMIAYRIREFEDEGVTWM